MYNGNMEISLIANLLNDPNYRYWFEAAYSLLLRMAVTGKGEVIVLSLALCCLTVWEVVCAAVHSRPKMDDTSGNNYARRLNDFPFTPAGWGLGSQVHRKWTCRREGCVWMGYTITVFNICNAI